MALQDGLALEHVHRGHAGAPAVQRGDQRVRLDQFRARGVHQQGVGLHGGEVLQAHDAARLVVEPQVQRHHVALREEFLARGRHLQAVAQRLGARGFAAPHAHVHAEGAAIARHDLADAPVAPDAQRLAAQHRADAEIGRHGGRAQARLLPGAVLEVGDVLRQAPHGRHDQRPGQFGRGDGRAHALGHRDAALGAGRHVHVRTHLAGLRDELQARELLHELARDLGALADQHDDVGIPQPHRKLAEALDGVGVDLGGVGVETRSAMELADGVLVVVEDDNVHGVHGPQAVAARRHRADRHEMAMQVREKGSAAPAGQGSTGAPGPGGVQA